MPRRNAADLDLTLLRTLDALLRHRTVTGAAIALGQRQPAVSKQLARLRSAFDDPLFVRRRNLLEATERARALGDAVREILESVEQLRSREVRFDASRPATVRLLTADYATLVLLPGVLERIARTGVTIEVRPWRLDYAELLAAGEVDVVCAPASTAARADVVRRRLLDDALVVIGRTDHPALVEEPSLESLLASPHVQVTPDGRPGSVVDDALAALGRSRRVTVRVPSFAVVPPLLAGEALAILPARVASVLGVHGLAARPLPFAVPSFAIDAYVHARVRSQPHVQWFVAQLTEVARALGARRASRPSAALALHDTRRRGRGML